MKIKDVEISFTPMFADGSGSLSFTFVTDKAALNIIADVKRVNLNYKKGALLGMNDPDIQFLREAVEQFLGEIL